MGDFPIIFEINSDYVREAIEAGGNLRVEVKSPKHYKVTLVRRVKKEPQPVALSRRASNA
jgi:hypothetical protein